MAWISGYNVVNGVYQAYSAPEVNLTSGVNGASVYPGTGCIIFDRTRRSDSDPNNWRWSDANGMADDRIMARMIEDLSQGWIYNVLLAEVNVKNAPGATYFKQSICVYFNFNVSYLIYPRGSERAYTVTPSYKITRREYPNQGSGFTETTIAEGGANIQFSEINGEGIVGWIKSRFLIGMSSFTYQNTEYFGFYGYCEAGYSDAPINRSQLCGTGVPVSVLDTMFGSFEPVKKEDPNESPEEPPGPGKGGDGGGGGGHVLPNEAVPVPPLPDVAPCDISWLTVYKMASTQLSEFGQEMMEPDLWGAITQFFNNPLEAIVNIVMCPVDAPSSRSKTPQVGRGAVAKTWSNAYPVVDTQYVEVDCGSISIAPYWKSAFDYDPYTKFTIFLPFVGFKTLKSDEIMGRTIGVKYHFDVCTGDCVAFVYRTADPGEYEQGPNLPGVIAAFNGNCGVRVPISRQSADAAISAELGLMSQAMGIAGNIAGSFMGGGSDLTDDSNMHMSQISNQISSATMTAVNGLKSHIERSGNLGGSPGYMGILDPYIIREIPRQILPKGNESYYWKLEGYPANIGGKLGDMVGTGLQVVESIQLNNIPALENERREIISWLGKGVIV